MGYKRQFKGDDTPKWTFRFLCSKLSLYSSAFLHEAAHDIPFIIAETQQYLY